MPGHASSILLRTHTQPTYLLHIPSWVLPWHLTLAARHASHALVMRGARGAGPGAGAVWAGAPMGSMLRICISNGMMVSKEQHARCTDERLGGWGSGMDYGGDLSPGADRGRRQGEALTVLLVALMHHKPRVGLGTRYTVGCARPWRCRRGADVGQDRITVGRGGFRGRRSGGREVLASEGGRNLTNTASGNGVWALVSAASASPSPLDAGLPNVRRLNV